MQDTKVNNIDNMKVYYTYKLAPIQILMYLQGKGTFTAHNSMPNMLQC